MAGSYAGSASSAPSASPAPTRQPSSVTVTAFLSAWGHACVQRTSSVSGELTQFVSLELVTRREVAGCGVCRLISVVVRAMAQKAGEDAADGRDRGGRRESNHHVTVCESTG